MLRLLLDEQISPSVAKGLKARVKELVVFSLSEANGGALLGQPDEECLRYAKENGLTLVTYDRRTIPPLLKSWAESERSHAGVIFVDDKTIAPGNFGALVRALHALYQEGKSWDWANRVCVLRRG